MEIKKVAVLVIDKVAPMDIFGPIQVFNLAFELKEGEDRLTEPNLKSPLYKSFTVGKEKGTKKTNLYGNGIGIEIEYDFSDNMDYDILVIPGGAGVAEIIEDSEFMGKVKKYLKKAKIIFAVGLGTAILAETGLIDGVEATSSKLYLEDIIKKYPNVKWRCPARWVVAEKEDTFQMIISSAGISAGVDAALHIVNILDGPAVAENIAFFMETVMLNDPLKDDPFGFMCPECKI